MGRLAVAVLLASCRTLPPPPPPPLPSLAEKAAFFAKDLEDHLSPEGLLVYRIEPETDIAAGRYGELADAGIWTGCLLAAETLRHAATGDRSALERARRAARGLLLLERVTGVPGFFARSYTRVPRRPGVGNRSRAPDRPDLLWKGDVSRDQYAGILFGFSVARRLLPDPVLREEIGECAARIARHMLANDFRLTGPDRRTTTHGDLRGRIVGVPIGVNALISLAAIGLALEATGAPEFRAALDDLERRGWLEAARWAHVEILGVTNYNNVNMAFLAIHALLGHRGDPRLRVAALRALDRSHAAVAREGNALADAILLTARPGHREALADARSALERFPLDRRALPVDLRGRAEFPRAILPDRKGKPRSRVPIPPDLRPASAFLWKSDPYVLVGNLVPDSALRKYSGVDFLLAYWMLRSSGFLGGDRAP